MEKLKVFEVFAGVGTQHMALKRMGIPFEIVGISEIKDATIASYEAIHGEANNLGDISKLNVDELPEFDFMTYSFPCQDITKAGKNLGLSQDSGTRSSMLWECKRVIEGKKPKFLLLENVKNLISKKHKDNFDLWLEWLEEQGYTNYTKVINAKDHNIPQKRERVFTVSFRDDHTFTFPEAKPLERKVMDFLDENSLDNIVDSYYTDLLVMEYLEDGIKITNNTKKGYDIAKIGDTINYSYPTSKTKRGRIGKDGTVVTLMTGVEIGIVMPDLSLKRLSPLECWRLMGMSDEDYYKSASTGASKSLLYEQAGNAIVVDVLVDLFKNMFTNNM